MGRGDIKTKRGKIARGSYGVTRPRKKATAVVSKSVAKEETETKKPTAKKPAAKKVAKKEE
jgi:30S ribosomal protein S31